MPRSCYVPGCKSNYSLKSSLISAFKFPKVGDVRREKWIRSIHRADFEPSENSVVCIKHFDERFIIREDIFKCSDGSELRLPRKRVKLHDDAYPTIFEGQPQYCTKNLSATLQHPEEREDTTAGCEELSEQKTEDFVTPVTQISSEDSDLCKLPAEMKLDAALADSVIIDHDYIITAPPRKSQVSETEHFSESKKEESLAKQRSLENLKRELCRLCGQAGYVFTPIFEPASDTSEDESISIQSKIEMYLPIKVKLEDALPFCICSNCLLVLNNWHQLYTTCVAADKILLKIFGEQSHKDTAVELYAGELQRNAETQTEPMPSYPLEDEMRRDGEICSLSGKSNIRTVQTEEKSFKKEFEKFVRTYHHLSYKCRFCHQLFKHSGDRKTHMAICNQLSTICEVCGFQVTCRMDLVKHKLRKHKPQTYLCDKCHRFFKSVNGLHTHLERFHSGVNRVKKYCCELCGSVFMLKENYCAHKRKHEKGTLKPVFQLKAFSSEEHSEGFENSVVYSCPVCEEKFNDMLSLAVHVNEKKKLKCSLCKKIIANEKRLFLHVCDQWTCQYCLKSFDQRIKWLHHERLHTGEKPIKCRRCDRTFRTYTARRKHEMKHEQSV